MSGKDPVRPKGSEPAAVPKKPSSSSEGSPVGSYARSTSIARLGSPVPSSFLQGSPAVRQVPTPSQLAVVDPSPIATPLPGLDEPRASLPAAGESALANALRQSGTPPRFGTPPIRSESPAIAAAAGKAPRSNYGSFDARNSSPAPAPFEDADIVRRHLVMPGGNSPSRISAIDTHFGSPGRSSVRGRNRGDSHAEGSPSPDEDFSSLQLQGGDVTRGIYRWVEQQDAEARGNMKRSMSFHGSRARPQDQAFDIDSIKQPGGFRRNYLRRNAASPSPGPSNYGTRGEAQLRQPQQQPFTSSFLEFLSLYGHFAGEELEEDDEVLGPDEYFSEGPYEDTAGEESDDEREPGEGSALLGTPGKRRRRRKEKAAGKGSPTGAALLLLKSFVGTGVLFLPRAYYNGGMLFSNLVLLAVALLSYYCFVLLIAVRLKVAHSFGDMGFYIYGHWMRNLINFSLVLSQIGFSSAYIVFVAENLQAFVLAVTDCRSFIDVKYFILMQMIVFLPVSLYRNINNIQKLALIADVFIVLGLVYLYYYDLFTIVSNHGIADIANFNSKTWTLFIGTAMFTFEGIGLVIPIQSGMKDPSKFPTVMALVMVIITVIFTSMGALSYAAYGSNTKTVVILNMPQDSKFVNAVQFIYSLAILFSTPLQIYPAIEITSQQLFSKTGKFDPYIKWKKNIFRFFMVMLCAALAWAGANDLDKFVALVGCFACIPLVYIYPVSFFCPLMLHGNYIMLTLP